MKAFCKYCEIDCKYLQDDGECSLSVDNKAPLESSFFIPEECENYGILFFKLEEIKQKVRKYKEEIVYYESIIISGTKEEKVYRKIIASLEKFINKYSIYGADNW